MQVEPDGGDAVPRDVRGVNRGAVRPEGATDAETVCAERVPKRTEVASVNEAMAATPGGLGSAGPAAADERCAIVGLAEWCVQQRSNPRWQDGGRLR